MKDFISNAKGFTKNPLGIIGLFISLIYGFGSLVLTLDGQLEAQERLPLVWFLVLFPIIVLGAFVYLVVYHHKKLYGPGDYKDEKNFVVTHLPTAFNAHKADSEVEEVAEVEEAELNQITSSPHFDKAKSVAVRDSANRVDVKSLMAAVTDTAKGFQEQYAEAEDAVLKSLELSLGHSIQKHVAINFEGRMPLVADGIVATDKEFIVIEVKYPQFGLIGRKFKQKMEDLMHQVLVQHRQDFDGRTPRLIFAIGVQKEFRNILEKRLQNIKNDLIIPQVGVEFRIVEVD